MLVKQVDTNTDRHTETLMHTHTQAQDVLMGVNLPCVMTLILPHRWLSRLSMAVAGYSEQEKICTDQGEFSHCKTFVVCYRSLRHHSETSYMSKL